jgi:hypothetical protein
MAARICGSSSDARRQRHLAEVRASAVGRESTRRRVGPTAVPVRRPDHAFPFKSLNLSTNRPTVSEAADRVADYYRQRGLSGPPLQHETGTILGGFAKVESVAAGLQWGLRFLSLMMLTLGLTVALLLWWSARGLRAPPGAGYS